VYGFVGLALLAAFAAPTAIQSSGLLDLRAWVNDAAVAASSPGDRLEGRATVTDGDTISIDGVDARIRLYGIDAPESGQTCHDAYGKRYLCGSRSADHMAEMIGRSGRVTCFEEDRDRYGRIVAECTTPANVVINAEMVRSGWAVEYDDYSDGRYSEEERQARAEKQGMWQGDFVVPSRWRRGDRLASERVAAGQPTGCDIKGNISSNGRIYHVSGQEHYGRTKINVSKGERWFCSEQEAVAAGWRRAKR
jgi:endonuclease YncB( thermonuclease family)